MGLVSFSFNSDSPKDQGLLANNIVQKMKSNTLFESLQPEVLILEAAYTPFWDAYLEALKGGTDRRNLRDSLLTPMNKQMNKLGFLVEALAAGDATIAQASGFEMKKTSKASKSSVKDLSPPTNVTIKKYDGKLGAALMEWKGGEGSKSFDIYNRMPNDEAWANGKHTTKQSIVLTDLPLGKYVEFCVSARGSGEMASDYSSVVGIWIS